MIRLLILAAASLLTIDCYSQIDYSKLIIGRNNGTMVLHDGNITDIFGFAETLGESISLPGPTINITEGDSVQIDFWNVSQGAPHTIHLHGLDVNQENDGVPALSYEVHHMDHGYYKFKAPHPGTYIYHCHVVSTIHVQAGMYGVIIVKPSDNSNTTWIGGESFDRDILFNASEIDTNWHTQAVLDHEHDTVNPVPMFIPDVYTPQYFLVNGQSGTQLTDQSNFYTVGESEDVFMRLVNIGYYGVRYIFPTGLNARTISSDGRPLPVEAISDTVEVLPGERYGTMIQTGTNSVYPVTVEHFNMNTQIVESTQTISLQTSALGINDLSATQIEVYPNPSIDGVFVSTEVFEQDYTVTSLDGKLILQSSNQTIDLSDNQSGVYILNYLGSSIRLVKY